MTGFLQPLKVQEVHVRDRDPAISDEGEVVDYSPNLSLEISIENGKGKVVRGKKANYFDVLKVSRHTSWHECSRYQWKMRRARC